MNVKDFGTVELPTGDRLDAIFERQRSLMEKYEHIEAQNGLLETPDVPVNVQDRRGQARLKNFAWRMTEELTEATEAAELHPDDPTHALEELADALHFLVELEILAGVEPAEIVRDCLIRNGASPTGDSLEQLFAATPAVIPSSLPDGRWVYNVVEAVGIAMNLLKLKPWKTSHILTDVKRFRERLCYAFEQFVLLSKSVGMTSQDVFEMYFKKSEVNKFRQRSAY